MSVDLKWKITAQLEGKWTRPAIQDLNAAMNSWWADWCDNACFFKQIRFSTQKKVVEVESSSEEVQFNATLDYSVNGSVERWAEYYGHWAVPFEQRESFDRTIHQRLLDSMKSAGTAIVFTVNEECNWDVFPGGETYTIRVTSDGSQFVLVNPDDLREDFIITARLYGDWTKEAIDFLNRTMDCMEKAEDVCPYYNVRAVHFIEPEQETEPVSMGKYDIWGHDMAGALCDALARTDFSGLPEFQMLLDEMKTKGLRVMFYAAGNGFDYHGYCEMYSDGKELIFI